MTERHRRGILDTSAATALANDLPVYTANPDDFEQIEGLEVVAVEPAAAQP